MKENNEWKFGLVFMVIAFLVIFATGGWAKYVGERKAFDRLTERYAEAQEEITYLDWNLNSVIFERDNLKADLEKQPECRPNRCDGDLIACLHNEKYYKNALDNVSPYCSEGIYELTIDGLRERVEFLEGQLTSCTNAYTREFWGEVVSCGWDMCKCAFGELGWVGPDRELCDELDITPYYVAWTLCVYDDNCSSCLDQTDGNVNFCFPVAYHSDWPAPMTFDWMYQQWLDCKSDHNCTTWGD